jgi:nicotinamidase/pyrazinamidase
MIFWDVDTQRDFMVPGGKLYVPGAEQIIPNLGRLTCWAAGHKVLVISSTDAHQPNDPEFSQYPPHCLAGTEGQHKVSVTLLANRVVIPNAPIDIPTTLTAYDQIIIEKQSLDVFSNPNIEALLERLGWPLDVVLYGVVTEICVSLAARDLLNRGHGVTLLRDAVQAFDQSKGQEVIEEVQRRGGKIATTDEILS